MLEKSQKLELYINQSDSYELNNLTNQMIDESSHELVSLSLDNTRAKFEELSKLQNNIQLFCRKQQIAELYGLKVISKLQGQKLWELVECLWLDGYDHSQMKSLTISLLRLSACCDVLIPESSQRMVLREAISDKNFAWNIFFSLINKQVDKPQSRLTRESFATKVYTSILREDLICHNNVFDSVQLISRKYLRNKISNKVFGKQNNLPAKVNNESRLIRASSAFQNDTESAVRKKRLARLLSNVSVNFFNVKDYISIINSQVMIMADVENNDSEYISSVELFINSLFRVYKKKFFNNIRFINAFLDYLIRVNDELKVLDIIDRVLEKYFVSDKLFIPIYNWLLEHGDLERIEMLISSYNIEGRREDKHDSIVSIINNNQAVIDRHEFIVKSLVMLDAVDINTSEFNSYVINLNYASDSFDLAIPALIQSSKEGMKIIFSSFKRTRKGIYRYLSISEQIERVINANVESLTLEEVQQEIEGIISRDQSYLSCCPKFNIVPSYIKDDISWSASHFKINNIDCFSGVAEYLRNTYRTPIYEYSTLSTYGFFSKQIFRAKLAIHVCMLVERLAKLSNKECYFVSTDAQSSPSQCYMAYSIERGHENNVSFVSISSGYENYSSSSSKKLSTTISAANISDDPMRRGPIFSNRVIFEGLKFSVQNLNDVLSILEINRVSNNSENQKVVLAKDKIQKAKSDGRKVICVFGKVLTDLGVSIDGGPAHEDQVDWLRHTSYLAKHSNALVIVKPHPHEKNLSITRYPVTKMSDYFVESDNLMVLESDWFNIKEIVEHIDLAVLWNGSSAAELIALGCPVLMCAYAARFDYPFKMNYPNSRKDYSDIIINPPEFYVSTEQRNNALKQIWMQSKCKLSVPQNYIPVKITNDPISVPRWDENDAKELLEYGDEKLSELFSRAWNHMESADSYAESLRVYRLLKGKNSSSSIRNGMICVHNQLEDLGYE